MICYFISLNKGFSQDITKEKLNLESYVNNEISLCGKVLHVCHVNNDKMKLQLADGQIVIVRFKDQNSKFDRNNTGKEINITGILHLQKLNKTEINSNYEQQNLLCHVDLAPCVDSMWVDGMWEKGSAKQYLDTTNEKLINTMAENGKDYISVYSIFIENDNIIFLPTPCKTK